MHRPIRRKKTKWQIAREELRKEGHTESEIDDMESAAGDIKYHYKKENKD